jgi:hypothetical protein
MKSQLILTERSAVQAIARWHEAVGEAVRQGRRITGLSQEIVAESAGMSTTTYRRCESGARILRPAECERVALVLGSGLLSEPELTDGAPEGVIA